MSLQALIPYPAFVLELLCPLCFPSSDTEGLPCNWLIPFRVPQIETDNVDIIGQILQKNPDLKELLLVFTCEGKMSRRSWTCGHHDQVEDLDHLASPGTLGPLLDRLAGLEQLHLEE
jgi:hypothetical protein